MDNGFHVLIYVRLNVHDELTDVKLRSDASDKQSSPFEDSRVHKTALVSAASTTSKESQVASGRQCVGLHRR